MSDDDKYPSQLAERFQIRLPDGMRDRIRVAAEKNNRSMNAEIVARLENSFAPNLSNEHPSALAELIANLVAKKLVNKSK